MEKASRPLSPARIDRRPRRFRAEEPRMLRWLAVAGPLALMGCADVGVRGFSLASFTSSGQEQRRGALLPVPGVADEIVEACRRAVAAAAAPHGATLVEAVSAGVTGRLPEGLTEAPIEARITYEQGPDIQVRQSRIACRLSESG